MNRRAETFNEHAPHEQKHGVPPKETIRAYGDSVVFTFHRDTMSTKEHLSAQKAALEAYRKKIEAGLVAPETFLPDMLVQLGVTEDAFEAESEEEATRTIAEELKTFVEKELISPHEATVILNEAVTFAQLYNREFPFAERNVGFAVARDNARKIAFQTAVDKTTFTGSDHGSKHILEGDMKFAEQMVQSLRDNGIPVSGMDQLLIHQAITDHDLGYAAPLAREEGARQAVEDHPLFSTTVVEANEASYVERFGRAGYETIRYAVLQHSYPGAEFATDPDAGIDPELVRSIVAMADALGVTAETKVPTVFKRPDAMRVIMKMRLALELSAASSNGTQSLSEAQLDAYREELNAIIDREPVAKRRASFKRAVDHFLSPFIAERAIGQYGGVVDGVEVTKRDGKVVPLVHMHLSRVNHLIGKIFGDAVATTAFNKAMSDFGVSEDQIQEFGEERRKSSDHPDQKEHFIHESSLGVFDIGTEGEPGQRESLVHADVQDVVEDVFRHSIRGEIRTLIRHLDTMPMNATEEIERFLKEVGDKISPTERTTLETLAWELIWSADRPAAARELRRFVTEGERRFIQSQPSLKT